LKNRKKAKRLELSRRQKLLLNSRMSLKGKSLGQKLQKRKEEQKLKLQPQNLRLKWKVHQPKWNQVANLIRN